MAHLTGIHSVSAAETFTQALINREPAVTRIGQNTQGVFSDVLGRRLPNGWRFGLPNERFVTNGKSYDGPPVFRKVSFELERGERLLVMGFNGAGKTSMLRVLAGEITADEGLYSFGHGVQPGYYAQEHEGLVRGRDVLSHMRELSEAPEPQLRALLR